MSVELHTSAELNVAAPERCALCDRRGTAELVDFRQNYDQPGLAPVRMYVWRCTACGAWFAHPLPTAQEQSKHWESAMYADPQYNDLIRHRKRILFGRILDGLSARVEKGELLDVGSNFGAFLELARDAGWKPSGFEPNADAAAYSNQQGIDVRSGWDLTACGFADGQFSAITVIDTFCYSLSPFAELQVYRRLLRPGGVLAMRITNKHTVLRTLHRLLPAGESRDRRMMRVISDQFHSISPKSLQKILSENGFRDVALSPGAGASPPREMRRKTRLYYGIAATIRMLTFGQVDLSPGVLVFATKSS